jgi:hypothetical protein
VVPTRDGQGKNPTWDTPESALSLDYLGDWGVLQFHIR